MRAIWMVALFAGSSALADGRDYADVTRLARGSDVVAVGSIESIGLDPTSRRPRIVGLFRVEDAIGGVVPGETFTVVWNAPLPKNALIPQAGERIVLFGENGLDGFVRPAGNGSGVFKVIAGSDGAAAGAYRDLRDFHVQGSVLPGPEEFLPLEGFVQALRDAR